MRRIKTSYMASAHRRAMSHKAKSTERLRTASTARNCYAYRVCRLQAFSMCSVSHKLKKYRTPAHRRVPLVRSSPCVIAPSRSPYFGHFAKALQNVSKVRCSLVWAIMDSSAETLTAPAVRRRFLQVCGESAAHRYFRIYAPICRRS